MAESVCVWRPGRRPWWWWWGTGGRGTCWTELNRDRRDFCLCGEWRSCSGLVCLYDRGGPLRSKRTASDLTGDIVWNVRCSKRKCKGCGGERGRIESLIAEEEEKRKRLGRERT